jgi:hypothetical protein
VGLGAVLLQETVSAFPLKPRQEAGLLILILAVPAVALTIYFLMPAAARTMLRHKDLLVPLVALLFFQAAVGWLMLVAPIRALWAPAWPLKLWVITLPISVLFFVQVGLQVAYGAWITSLIIQVVRTDRADLVQALKGLRWFLRVFCLELFGWLGLFSWVALGLAVGMVALPLAFIFIGVGSLLWNLASAAILLVGLDDRLGFWQTFPKGILVSWRFKRKWWKPVVVQLFLLGIVTFVAVSYTDTPRPGTVTSQSKTNFSVNGFWTGGYENECRWYGKLMVALDAPTLELIATALGLLFGILAIAVKLTIAASLEPPILQAVGPPQGEPRSSL